MQRNVNLFFVNELKKLLYSNLLEKYFLTKIVDPLHPESKIANHMSYWVGN
jgi:hypothetical protein